jgi:K+-sensing histidine kinase KdpD
MVSHAIDWILTGPDTLLGVDGGAQAALGALIGAWVVFVLLGGLALRRMRKDRRRCRAAERTAAQAGRLAQLTAALAQARTPRAAIEAAIQEALHALQADAGALFLVSRDGKQAESARGVGYPQGQAPSRSRRRPRSRTPSIGVSR